jgi:hypothetical protein
MDKVKQKLIFLKFWLRERWGSFRISRPLISLPTLPDSFFTQRNAIIYGAAIFVLVNLGWFLFFIFSFSPKQSETETTSSLEKVEDVSLPPLPFSPQQVSLTPIESGHMVKWLGTGEEGKYYQVYRKAPKDEGWTFLTTVDLKGNNQGWYEYEDSSGEGSFIYGVSMVDNYERESELSQTSSQQTDFISSEAALKDLEELPEGLLYEGSLAGNVSFIPLIEPGEKKPYWGFKVVDEEAARIKTGSGHLNWAYVDARSGEFICADTEFGLVNDSCWSKLENLDK